MDSKDKKNLTMFLNKNAELYKKVLMDAYIRLKQAYPHDQVAVNEQLVKAFPDDNAAVEKFLAETGNTIESVHEVSKSASQHKEAVSPPGWKGTVERMKQHPEITNPWALTWWMKSKGYTPKKASMEKSASGEIDLDNKEEVNRLLAEFNEECKLLDEASEYAGPEGTEVTSSQRMSGRVPGVPDGTGPHGGTPQCQMTGIPVRPRLRNRRRLSEPAVEPEIWDGETKVVSGELEAIAALADKLGNKDLAKRASELKGSLKVSAVLAQPKWLKPNDMWLWERAVEKLEGEGKVATYPAAVSIFKTYKTRTTPEPGTQQMRLPFKGAKQETK